ncbi:MAG: hypothetical protein LQ345_001613 [Seirophora villosa]|nr:MAG: hypothetical protein LQ345_001613 [Seirophora villosa]
MSVFRCNKGIKFINPPPPAAKRQISPSPPPSQPSLPPTPESALDRSVRAPAPVAPAGPAAPPPAGAVSMLTSCHGRAEARRMSVKREVVGAGMSKSSSREV